MAKKFSKYFSLEELTRTNPEIFKRYGIKNEPNQPVIDNLQRLAKTVLDPLREAIGKPLYISSGFRNLQYNKIIGGATNSQHLTGEAVDIDGDATGVSNKLIFEELQKLPFDQIIWEFGDKEPDWVHVSLRKEKNRRNILKAVRSNGVTKYVNFAQEKS